MSQPAFGPNTRIIRMSPIRPASMAAFAAIGAPRKRCCETTAEPDARGIGRGDHRIGVGAGVGHRLLDDDVLAGRRGRLDERPVARDGRRDDDGVDVGARQQRLRGVEPRRRAVGRAPPRRARRRRRRASASGTWRAMTRAQVWPMKPDPMTPNRTGSATVSLRAATTGVDERPERRRWCRPSRRRP